MKSILVLGITLWLFCLNCQADVIYQTTSYPSPAGNYEKVSVTSHLQIVPTSRLPSDCFSAHDKGKIYSKKMPGFSYENPSAPYYCDGTNGWVRLVLVDNNVPKCRKITQTRPIDEENFPNGEVFAQCSTADNEWLLTGGGRCVALNGNPYGTSGAGYIINSMPVLDKSTYTNTQKTKVVQGPGWLVDCQRYDNPKTPANEDQYSGAVAWAVCCTY